MLAVTTFSPAGYEEYGKYCLETFAENWPGRIIAYVEKDIPVPPQVETRDFWSVRGWKEWHERAKKHPGTDGFNVKTYDFRYDALKYCRKVFVQDAVFDEDEFVWWIDADCIAKEQIPETYFTKLLSGVALAYMGRAGRETYTETGVVGFNTKHPDFVRFRAAYLPWITSGKIFSQLKGWHDCIAFDQARVGISGNNLTPSGRMFENVITNASIGRYIHHYKGPRKVEMERENERRKRSSELPAA